MTELLWHASRPTGQTRQNPYCFTLSPQAWEGPVGPEVWRSGPVSLSTITLQSLEKEKVCPTSFRFYDPDLHLTPFFVLSIQLLLSFPRLAGRLFFFL